MIRTFRTKIWRIGMKRFCRVFVNMLCIAIILISCNIFKKEIELLVDEDTSISSPRWHPNGDIVYYSLSNGPLYSINIATNDKNLISNQEEKITNFDISPDGSEICFVNRYTTIYFLSTESGEITDSISVDTVFTYTFPIYSPTDNKIIYYLDWIDETIHAHKVNRDNSTDSILFSTNLIERVPCFDVSCDESWLAVGDILFSLKGDGDKISLKHTLLEVSWHPLDPEYLVGTDGTYSDILYFYDLGKDKWSKTTIQTNKSSNHSDLAFSPDGSAIAVTSTSSEGEFNNSDLWLYRLNP